MKTIEKLYPCFVRNLSGGIGQHHHELRKYRPNSFGNTEGQLYCIYCGQIATPRRWSQYLGITPRDD